MADEPQDVAEAGRVAYKAGETIELPDLARRCKDGRRGAPRAAAAAPPGLAAARDRFYKGDIAREIVSFLSENDSPFER